MDNDRLTKAYLKIRDARKQLKKDFEAEDAKLEEKLNMVGGLMLRFLQDHKTDAIRTDAGTFYRQVDVKPAASDWDAFYKWVSANDAFDFLEKRIKKTSIVEYMEAHEEALPPGVSVFREYVIRVRTGD